MKKSFGTLRKPVAVAPGLTVRSKNVYMGPGDYAECVVIEGDVQALDAKESGILFNWLARWFMHRDEIEAEKRAIAEVRAAEDAA